MKNKLSAIFNKPNRRSLLLTTIRNAIYSALMGSVILPWGVWSTILYWWGYGWFKPSAPPELEVIALLLVEGLAILFFSIFVLLAYSSFKSWLIALPIQYVVCVLIEWIAYLCWWIPEYHAGCHNPYFHIICIFQFLRPLVLLAVQTLILYLRHRRRLRREGDGAKG